ncbi:hypothetical protein [Aurantiacibacter gilvus]|uniref:Secreted protein n=1 Tax=Aurantiacibacter gilvus TaxID=3139141 RepID=A0ABU9IEI0_9SPHN
MKNLILATASALSLAAVPAAAEAQQREAPEDAPAFYSAAHEELLREMSPDFRIHFDTLDEDQQALYFGWNDALRGYYHTLNDEQRHAWWYLNDEQRIQLYQVQGEAARDAAWDSVIAQVGTLEAQQAAAPERDTSMTFVSNAVVQDIPMPAHPDEYPVCEGDNDDHCINAWAAGQRGPGVDRPLDYWPGRPASEMQSGG